VKDYRSCSPGTTYIFGPDIIGEDACSLRGKIQDETDDLTEIAHAWLPLECGDAEQDPLQSMFDQQDLWCKDIITHSTRTNTWKDAKSVLRELRVRRDTGISKASLTNAVPVEYTG
jgi:hypothetical protein